MKISQSQLRKIIQEEFTKVSRLKEDDTPFGERNYDHSLVSNVSKTIEWEIFSAFNFVLDLLEDVNAHTEYREVRKVLEKASQSDLNQASQEPVLGDVGPVEEYAAVTTEGLQDEGLRETIEDFLAQELSGWHDVAKAQLHKHVAENGFDISEIIFNGLGGEVQEK